jgi:[acyl-carrier-protein] S-malonyltransferase
MTSGFIFPGQGSQSVGMLRDLHAARPTVAATFDEASKALGYDLWELVSNGPESDLNHTEKTQPAMLTAGVAVWRLWKEEGGAQPAFLAGHSLGEYTALVCAGALAFADAVTLVADRGRFMQEAVPTGTGAMAAVLGLEDREIQQACEEAAQGEVVACANFNSPGQVVIAGQIQAVARAIDAAKAKGAKRAVLLPVSVPSHCALMKSAAERLSARIRQIPVNPPVISVIHNADVSSHADPQAIIEALVKQLYRPVRWVEVVQKLAGAGVTTLVECGPGKVLAGLSKRIAKNLSCLSIHDSQSLNEALSALR